MQDFKCVPTSLYSLELEMDIAGRRAAPSEQIRALNDSNIVLQADNAGLEKANMDLKAENNLLRQRIKSLQVAVTILLASSAGLSVGLATSTAGAKVQTAIASATAVFFGVIMASIAILTFMRRNWSGS